jgi:hypothetical protein
VRNHITPYFVLGEIKVKIKSVKGYDEYGYEVMDFSLPTMDEATEAAREVGRALSSMGISASEMVNSLRRLNEAFAHIDYLANEVTAIKDELSDLRYIETERKTSELSNRIDVVEMELNDIRSALDEKTETPNQKGDLEIFSQIEWDEAFLKFGDGNMFLN